MAYLCIMTTAGRALIANALALGSEVDLTEMAVGDGGGAPITPLASMEALVGEQHRAAINTLYVSPSDPGTLVAELVIPATIGGWTMREVGLFDGEGNLVAVANMAEAYKPIASEGSTSEETVRMHLTLTEAEAGVVRLKIDPTVVLASRGYVDVSIEEHDVDPDAHGAILGDIASHIQRTDNPHGVTAEQAGAAAEDHTHETADVVDLLSDPHVWTAQQTIPYSTLAYAATMNWNVAAAPTAVVTLEGNPAWAAPTNLADGGIYILRLVQDATGGRVATWHTVFSFPGDEPPELTADAGAVDLVVGIYNAAAGLLECNVTYDVG